MNMRDDRAFALPEVLVAIILAGLLGAILFSLASVGAGNISNLTEVREESSEFSNYLYEDLSSGSDSKDLRWYSAIKEQPAIYSYDLGWIFYLEPERGLD